MSVANEQSIPTAPRALSKKDFESGQDPRWCPGCGDYAILAQAQKVFATLGIPREKFVIISGIGCSSRFPYYMNTYGFHTIHGRALAIATGVKTVNPSLEVWVATGDGDALSIGGNHFIHTIRRNVNIKILLFNNRIYGLTKGQYSPTSERGKVTKSSPEGTVENPFNPISVAIGAGATFAARTMDRDLPHLQETLLRAHRHQGTAFVEIFQNCNIYNDGAWELFTEKETKAENTLYLEQGKPLVFGVGRKKGIRLNGFKPEVVTLGENGVTEKDLMVHNDQEEDSTAAYVLSRMMEQPGLPVPLGVFRAVQHPCFEKSVDEQMRTAAAKPGDGDLRKLIETGDTWTVN